MQQNKRWFLRLKDFHLQMGGPRTVREKDLPQGTPL